ncbi:MAG: hypothetical protein H6606_03865 [Flavobacteriales bacterium]|nr:hypothetical protein [Flavobacteriales bacterium]
MKNTIVLLITLACTSLIVSAQSETLKISTIDKSTARMDPVHITKIFTQRGLDSLIDTRASITYVRRFSKLRKEEKKYKTRVNKFQNRRYFIYYDSTKHYIGGKNGEYEDYYLGMAVWMKNIENSLRERRNLRQFEVTVADNPQGTDDQLDIERQRERIWDIYVDSINDAHNLSVEYFFKYRNTRKLVFGVGKGKDKSLRTSLFYENNLEGKQNRFLNNYGLNFNQNGVPVVTTELFKDYFPYVRFSVSTVMNSTAPDTNAIGSDDLKEDALQRIIAGGGNVVGKLSSPIFHYTNTSEGILDLHSTANVKFGIDVPRLGTLDNDVNLMANPYVNMGLVYNGYKGDIAILGDVSFGYLRGSSQYYDYLGIDKNSSIRNRGMFMHKLECGFAFGRALRLTYGYLFGDEYWRSENVNQISVVFVPN